MFRCVPSENQQARPDPCPDCWGEGTNELFSAEMPDGRFLQAIWVYPGPKMLALAKLAGALIEYCHASENQRARIARDIEKKAKELQRRIAR